MFRRLPPLFAILALAAPTRADDVAPPVTATATRSTTALDAATTPTEVIDAATIDALAPRDPAELLEGRPGLRVTRTHRGAGLSIQGLDGKHVLVLVDGERVGGRRGEEIDLSRLATADIARIEIVRGAASALYGSDAVGGVINIITRTPPARPSTRIELQAGNLAQGTLSARVGGGAGDLTLDFGAALDTRDAFRLDAASPTTHGSAFDRAVASLATRYRPNARFHLDTRVDHTFRVTSGLNALALPPDLDGNPRFRLTDHRSTLHVTTFRIAPTFRFDTSELALSLSGTFSSDLLVQTMRGGLSGPSRDPSRERLVNLNGRFTSDLGTSDHLFTFGLDSFVETLDSTRLATGSAVRVRAGLYAQDEWTLLDDLAWRLTPGVRLDLDSDYGAILTPRLATAITPIEALTLRFSAGLGFRGPGFRELHFAFDNAAVGYTVAGNPDLRPEHGLSLQTGATVSILPEALSLRAELFMHRLRDLITTAPITTPGAAGDRFTYINIGRAISQGAEFALEMKGPCGLAASLGYSLIDARDAATDLRLPGRALHNAELELHWRPRELPVSAMLRASFIGERIHEIATPGGLERRSFDADLLLDARIAWQLDAHVEVFAVADNLLDAGHPDALPIAPRSVRAGLRSRFD